MIAELHFFLMNMIFIAELDMNALKKDMPGYMMMAIVRLLHILSGKYLNMTMRLKIIMKNSP